MKKITIISRVLSLALAVCLLCTSCGSPAKATTMNLIKTEGTVDVRDDAGDDVSILENLKLYSGYGVETLKKSYAWIKLDNVKLAKLDAVSEAVIEKDEGDLEIEIKSGSLFFNVTEPLDEDESMEIHTSTMTVGIRGTCGWVELEDERHMNVYLLEGTVECTLTDQSGKETSARVSAGEMATLSLNEDGTGEISVAPFTVSDVPEFVLTEAERDEALAEDILDASGLDVLNPPAFIGTEALSRLPYYGDLSQCHMTAEQAQAYAQILEDNVRESETAVWSEWYSSGNYAKPKFIWASLFDTGDGIPALWVVGGYDMQIPVAPQPYLGENPEFYPFMSRIYQWDGTQAVLATDTMPENGYSAITEEGLVFLHQTDFNYNTISTAAELYPLSGGQVSGEPTHVLQSIIIEQQNHPSSGELQTFIAAHGNSDQSYDYGTLSGSMWNDWGMGTPEWHVYALDGTFMGPDDVRTAWEELSGLPYWGIMSDASTFGEFGFGGYGAQDTICKWRGDWRDCTEIATLLREAAQ
ncbi:MAG: FecR domain-containing protein [Coprococcus sp.]|nr:FecR domain-containing protein [Coprococcus sp.]